jgi:pilus assembly protein CpaB
MAAILPSGMRAVATQITPESGVGGFILPNDRVDVIMTPRNRDDKSGERTSETILRNIRVLAIDQNVEEKNGQKVVVGKTATLELTPGQAETLARTPDRRSVAVAAKHCRQDSRRKDGRFGASKRQRCPVRREHHDHTKVNDWGIKGTWRPKH